MTDPPPFCYPLKHDIFFDMLLSPSVCSFKMMMMMMMMLLMELILQYDFISHHFLLSHSLIHSLTHSLIHSFTHSLITRSKNYSHSLKPTSSQHVDRHPFKSNPNSNPSLIQSLYLVFLINYFVPLQRQHSLPLHLFLQLCKHPR